ncbi:hypothetical protein AB0O01_06260 [Streptomyces sp. NPDC093252]|uniref:hypothetical protein n=1 Tax=Streptomyces sp. NPDC093252 TaxID=3154980 RepID=UPI003428E964
MPGIDECLLETMRLPGARGAALVDWTSGLALGVVGEFPGGDAEAAAAETAELARPAAELKVFAPQDDASGGGGVGGGGMGAPGGPGQAASPGQAGSPRSPGSPGPPVEDLIVTSRDGYHVLRFLPTSFESTVVLHVWLSRADGNLALARIRLGEISGRLVLG